jgi:hypothetical protein
MKDGEEVVFRYRDLFGFSDNVKLQTTISLQLSTMMFGTYFYRIAKCRGGDGRLLLSVKGSVIEDDSKVKTLPIGSLIAWNTQGEFRVVDDRSKSAVWKDGISLGRVQEGNNIDARVLVGSATSGGIVGGPLGRFVRTFVIPF